MIIVRVQREKSWERAGAEAGVTGDAWDLAVGPEEGASLGSGNAGPGGTRRVAVQGNVYGFASPTSRPCSAFELRRLGAAQRGAHVLCVVLCTGKGREDAGGEGRGEGCV